MIRPIDAHVSYVGRLEEYRDLRALADYLLSKLVGMSTVGIHVADRLGCSAVTEEVKKLMDTFGVADVEAKSVNTGVDVC